jgi:4'-phosphopantetheinyl transferase
MWRLPVPESAVRSAAVELWCVQIDLDLPASTADLGVLSDTERERARRFRRQEDRARSVTSRAALRRLLGARLACDPSSVQLRTGPFGKPRLSGERAGLAFNVTHTRDVALIALAARGQVGIDIEPVDAERDTTGLDELVLSAAERAASTTASLALLERWVVKEAVLKVHGVGVSQHLTSLSVLPAVDSAYQLQYPSHWPMTMAWPVEAPADLIAALAWTPAPEGMSL